jgi:hypothetical protein
MSAGRSGSMAWLKTLATRREIPDVVEMAWCHM